jgi:hypothetical protein
MPPGWMFSPQATPTNEREGVPADCVCEPLHIEAVSMDINPTPGITWDLEHIQVAQQCGALQCTLFSTSFSMEALVSSRC